MKNKKAVSDKDIFYYGEFNHSTINLEEAEKLLHNLREELKKNDSKKIKWPWKKKVVHQ